MKKMLILLICLLGCSMSFEISALQRTPENLSFDQHLLNNHLQFFSQKNKEKTLIKSINVSKNPQEKIRLLETLYPEAPHLKNNLKKIDLASLELLNARYWKDKRGIYFWGADNPITTRDERTIFDEYLIKIKKADPQTFRILNNEKTLDIKEEIYIRQLSFENTSMYIEYAVDKNFVYDNGKILKGADPKSFEILKFGHLAKDEDQVFFRSRYDTALPNIELPGVDVKSFEVLSWTYAKDKNYVYVIMNCGGGSGRETCIERMKDADPQTFQLLTGENEKIFAKDKEHFYSKYGYTVDRFGNYPEEEDENAEKEYWEPTDNAIQEKIRTPDHQWLILQEGKRYLTNKHQKIWQKQLDPKTFGQFTGNQNYDFIPDDGLFSDKNEIYRYTKRLKGLTKRNFIYYGKSYTGEFGSYFGNHKIIYHQGERIAQADTKTFEVIDGISWTDARDKNFYYLTGKIVFKR